MLKLISKSFFVSVLCGSLMLMDFSYKGAMINAAQAESVKTDKISDKDLMGTLTMTVAGTIASRLYKYKMTTDVMLAAAGGAAFIGGEVMAYFKLKEVMKGMELQITRDKNGNINKEQIEALERLKKSYEEAKKTAQTKKTLQMAAAAAFAAAGVMAYTMATADLSALTTCTTGVTTALTTISTSVAATCASLTAGVYTAALGAQCTAESTTCSTAIGTYSNSLMAYEMSRQASGPSGPALAQTTTEGKALQTSQAALSASCPLYTSAASAALNSACSPLVPLNDQGTSGGAGLEFAMSSPVIKNLLKDENAKAQMIAELSKPNSMVVKYINQAFNLIFPPAQAELFSAMGIASSAAISYILATSATVGPTIDMFLLIPQKRAMAWGVLAGLTFAATSATENVISQIDANISKIDQILKSMYMMSNGATATQLANKQPAIQNTTRTNKQMQFNETDYGEVDLTKDGGSALPCYTGGDATKCKSFEDSVKDLPSFANLNAESQLQLKSILGTANGFNGTSRISSGTLKGASNMAGTANALKAALERAAKKNADALKNAKSKLNPEAESKKLSGLIEKNMNDGLKKSKSTPASMYASMYGGKSAVGGASSTATPASTDKVAAVAPVVPGANVVDISGAGGEKTDLGITGMETGKTELSAEEQAKLDAATTAAANAAGMDQYDLKNDISNDSTSSIFDLISNRYQKSGYPRLFKVKEPQTPAPVTK